IYSPIGTITPSDPGNTSNPTDPIDWVPINYTPGYDNVQPSWNPINWISDPASFQPTGTILDVPIQMGIQALLDSINNNNNTSPPVYGSEPPVYSPPVYNPPVYTDPPPVYTDPPPVYS